MIVSQSHFFEMQDLIALAENQFRWPDLTGYRADPDLVKSKPGMLLFTEAHLEYNAGLVISIGSPNRPSPIEATSTAENLAEELEDYRQQLLAMAAPPECPTEASQGGSLFTPLIGVPMEHSLDLAVVWALYGTYMCYQFWPMPEGACSDQQHLTSIKWPKRAHPGALTDAGRERTPWLTCWARASFEQGCLSVLPHLEGPCKAISLPGEHLFQASRIAPGRMRPVIFHAFGKAKLDAHDQLAVGTFWVGDSPNCIIRHAALPSGMVPGDMEASWWVLFYRGAECTNGQQRLSFLSATAMACHFGSFHSPLPCYQARGCFGC